MSEVGAGRDSVLTAGRVEAMRFATPTMRRRAAALRGFFAVELPGVPPVGMLDLGDDNVIRGMLDEAVGFEPTSLLLWSRLAAAADLVLDVGAYTGIYSLIASASSNRVTVLAFEPSPVTFSRLLVNIVANAMDRQIAPFNLALSDEPGHAELSMYGGLYTMSSGESIEAVPRYPPVFKRRVPKRAGDALLATAATELAGFDLQFSLEGRDISLIKVDVEGHEARVLRGLQQTIARCRPTCLVEVWSAIALDDIRSLLKGYEHAFISERGFLTREHRDGNNVLLWPEEGGRAGVLDACAAAAVEVDFS